MSRFFRSSGGAGRKWPSFVNWCRADGRDAPSNETAKLFLLLYKGLFVIIISAVHLGSRSGTARGPTPLALPGSFAKEKWPSVLPASRAEMNGVIVMSKRRRLMDRIRRDKETKATEAERLRNPTTSILSSFMAGLVLFRGPAASVECHDDPVD